MPEAGCARHAGRIGGRRHGAVVHLLLAAVGACASTATAQQQLRAFSPIHLTGGALGVALTVTNGSSVCLAAGQKQLCVPLPLTPTYPTCDSLASAVALAPHPPARGRTAPPGSLPRTPPLARLFTCMCGVGDPAPGQYPPS